MGKTVTSKPVPLSYQFIGDKLEWVMGCKEAFYELEDIDPDFKSINFIKEDWDDATLLYDGWKALKDWIKDVDHFLYPKHKTTNEYFQMIRQIVGELVRLEEGGNHYTCGIASHFRDEFDKYPNNSELVLVTQIILDPRFKIGFFVEDFYKMMYGNDAITRLNRIIGDVTNIFNQYAKRTNYSMSSSSQESELNCYLRDPKCPSNEGFNILQWWRLNSSIYPTLAKMARDFLSIPIIVTNIDNSFDDEIANFDKCLEILDDEDLKVKFTCTRIWLNSLENN